MARSIFETQKVRAIITVGSIEKQKQQQLILIKLIVDRANWLGNFNSFFVVCFCFLFLLFVGLELAQNTKGIDMLISN